MTNLSEHSFQMFALLIIMFFSVEEEDLNITTSATENDDEFGMNKLDPAIFAPTGDIYSWLQVYRRKRLV